MTDPEMTPEVERHLYECVLKRIEGLMGAEPGTPEGALLDFFTTIAESYEETHFPMAGHS